MNRDEAKMRRGILFLIEEVRRLVVNDADANEVLEILEELEASTKTRLRSCACGEPIARGYIDVRCLRRLDSGEALKVWSSPFGYIDQPVALFAAEPQGE